MSNVVVGQSEAEEPRHATVERGRRVAAENEEAAKIATHPGGG